MRQYQRDCERNPDLVFAEKVNGKPFEVLIKRSTGSLTFIHNKPIHTSKIMPRNKDQKEDEYTTDLKSIVRWLTGGDNGEESEETDVYGVVNLSVDLDVGSALVDVVGIADGDGADAEKKAAKTFKDMQSELGAKIKGAMVKARELADWRVKRAIRITHNNLMKQYETLKSDGKGLYTPSICEAIGAHILHEEIKEFDDRRRSMLSKFDSNMRTTTSLV